MSDSIPRKIQHGSAVEFAAFGANGSGDCAHFNLNFPDIKNKCTEIINVNPRSKYTVFNRISYDDLLGSKTTKRGVTNGRRTRCNSGVIA